MFKKIILAFALSMSAGSAFAACTNPLVIKDGGAANINMSMTSNADGFCQYNFNMAQINGVVPLMGNGATGTGSPRVTIANDNTIPTGWPTATNQTAAAAAKGEGATGAAVPSGAQYVGINVAGNLTGWTAKAGNTYAGTDVVPGVAVVNSNANGQATMANSSPVVLPSNMAAIALWGHGATGAAAPANATYAGVLDAAGGTNMLGLAGDPCQTSVKSTLPITLATAAVKVIAVGVSAKKIYVCQIHLTNNAADSVAVFEATTATTCATSPVAVVGAGTTVATAATGYNFAANGGISLGTGSNQVLQTSVNANDLCIAQSAATQLTGSITYVTR